MSQQAPVSSPASSKFFRWHRAVLHICFIVFTAELAFCLIYLPWRSDWESELHSHAFSETGRRLVEPLFSRCFERPGITERLRGARRNSAADWPGF